MTSSPNTQTKTIAVILNYSTLRWSNLNEMSLALHKLF
jgi:hypothetical protein